MRLLSTALLTPSALASSNSVRVSPVHLASLQMTRLAAAQVLPVVSCSSAGVQTDWIQHAMFWAGALGWCFEQ